MNHPRPSLADFHQEDPIAPPQAGYINNWIYQKNCYLCNTPLGYGQHRQKKLFCRSCRKAICLSCSAEPPVQKEALCTECSRNGPQQLSPSKTLSRPSIHGRFYPSEDIRLASPWENSPGLSADVGDRSLTSADYALRSSKSLLEELKRPTKPAVTEKGTGLLHKLQAKLTDYEMELVDVRKQVGIRAEQLDSREANIETVTSKLQVLSQTNSQLEQRVSLLEKVLERLSEKGSDINSTSDSKPDSCLSCSAF